MDAVKKQLVLAPLLPAWQQEIAQAWQGVEGEEKGLFWFGQEERRMFSLVAPKMRQHLDRGNLTTRPESSQESSQKLFNPTVVPSQAPFSWIYLIWDSSPFSPHSEIKQMSCLLLAPCQAPAWNVFQLLALSQALHWPASTEYHLNVTVQ